MLVVPRAADRVLALLSAEGLAVDAQIFGECDDVEGLQVTPVACPKWRFPSLARACLPWLWRRNGLLAEKDRLQLGPGNERWLSGNLPKIAVTALMYRRGQCHIAPEEEFRRHRVPQSADELLVKPGRLNGLRRHVLTADMQVTAPGSAFPRPGQKLWASRQPGTHGLPTILLRIQVNDNVGRLYHHTEIHRRAASKVPLQKGVISIFPGQLFPTAQPGLFPTRLFGTLIGTVQRVDDPAEGIAVVAGAFQNANEILRRRCNNANFPTALRC